MTLATAIDFIALVAYPESEPRRAKAAAAMRAYYLRQCRVAGTVQSLGKILAPQQTENQFRSLKQRLHKRLIAANDAIRLDMGLEFEFKGTPASLNDVVGEHQVNGDGYERYKSDWWVPKVMHLAIALRDVRLRWKDPRPYCLVPRQHPEISTDPGWKTDWPFTVETLLLLWPDWIDTALAIAPVVAEGLLRVNLSNALRGFKDVKFLYPPNDP